MEREIEKLRDAELMIRTLLHSFEKTQRSIDVIKKGLKTAHERIEEFKHDDDTSQNHGGEMTRHLMWIDEEKGWIAFQYKLNGVHHNYEYLEFNRHESKPREWPKL